MSTYREEKAAKDRAQARKAKKYVFRAAGMDRFHPYPHTPEDGTIVVKTQPYGCPRNGTMGQCYIADKDTGEFIGMVAEASLTPVKLVKEMAAFKRSLKR